MFPLYPFTTSLLASFYQEHRFLYANTPAKVHDFVEATDDETDKSVYSGRISGPNDPASREVLDQTAAEAIEGANRRLASNPQKIRRGVIEGLYDVLIVPRLSIWALKGIKYGTRHFKESVARFLTVGAVIGGAIVADQHYEGEPRKWITNQAVTSKDKLKGWLIEAGVVSAPDAEEDDLVDDPDDAIAELERQLAAAKAEQGRLQKEFERVTNDKNTADGDNENLNNQLAAANQSVAALQGTIANLKKQIEDNKQPESERIQQLNETIRLLQLQITDLEKKLAATKVEQERLQKDLQKATNDKNTVKSENEDLENQLKVAKQKVVGLEADITSLQGQLTKAQNQLKESKKPPPPQFEPIDDE